MATQHGYQDSTHVAAGQSSSNDIALRIVKDEEGSGSQSRNDFRLAVRGRHPHLYQAPGYIYSAGAGLHYRHKDYAGRVSYHALSDRYIHHQSGHLRNLYVACTSDIYQGYGNSTWRRTFIRVVAPKKVRIAAWIIDSKHAENNSQSWHKMVLRSLPAIFGMALVFWDGRPTIPRRRLAYAPVLYKYHGDAKAWSNKLENRKGISPLTRSNESYQLLRPRHLCFLRNPESGEIHGIDIRRTEEWEMTDGQNSYLSYLFVAYSALQFSHESDDDLNTLHRIAETACRAAKLPAYWIACSCFQDATEIESDVYRISDVVRGAHSMTIAVCQPRNASHTMSMDELLRHWGSRMWTFPELLLSPGQSVTVYLRGSNLSKPIVVPKNQFAARVWTTIDADSSRHLIDHFLGNINLSRLELATIGLKCLYSRNTSAYLPGDQAYALMGLLRLRPQIDRTDTAFEAFSRLSLANDSDMLLERFLCLLPLRPRQQPWYDMNDAYFSSLWEITPSCQVAGIADGDTVIVDGAYGVSVRWKSFYPVYWSTGPSTKRRMAGILMEWSAFIFLAGTAFLVAGCARKGVYRYAMTPIGAMLLFIFVYVWLMTPRIVLAMYGEKPYEVQAEMFGFEGYLDAESIERAIFGGNFGRFSWSTNGSPLSRSTVNEFGEKIGIDPCLDPEVSYKVATARGALPGQMRVFTLVDTYNMQLTLFESEHPPVALMFCGSEGGMQRALGCSYEWTTQTMYRETVLRLPTTSLDRMHRVPRFRLGICRPPYGVHPMESQS